MKMINNRDAEIKVITICLTFRLFRFWH